MFYADLHVHSKYSLATSPDCDLEHLALWAARKGIAVLGTGDFTHPAWFAELHEKLAPAEPGLFRLKPAIEKHVRQLTDSSFILHPPSFPPPRFMLQVEISTVYKKNGRVRKVHHVVYVPDFAGARCLIKKLERLGSLGSDGRPTLKLDSRDLLEIVLGSGEGCCLIPAHIWTPWFGALGSKSGFDSIEECYGDLSSEIFAVETGLSADPATNWRVSALDGYASVSNSDSHSPAKLGREATVFDTKTDYFSMFRGIRTGKGFLGTVEFYPEEGRYHHDGHRKCGVCLTPEESRKCKNKCPVCGKPLTLGVMHRVSELADRPCSSPSDTGILPVPSKKTTGKMPVPPIKNALPGPHIASFSSLIPFVEVLAEIYKVGPQSKRVKRAYDEFLGKLGPELFILEKASLDDISRNGSSLLAEAISRMRSGRVIRRPGFDGQYGTIRLFTDEELK
jgi:ATP-dependent DNA helicase UvrD/PcrA